MIYVQLNQGPPVTEQTVSLISARVPDICPVKDLIPQGMQGCYADDI